MNRRNKNRISQLEVLETRLVPAVLAGDDFYPIERNHSQNIDILANDSSSDGVLDPYTVAIVSNPSHGKVSFERLLNVNDDGSPLGNFASGLSDNVQTDGHIKLGVSGSADIGLTGEHLQTGDYALFIRIGKADFNLFDRNVFEYRLAESLGPGDTDIFDIPGLTPGTPFIAWIDNQIGEFGSASPDTIMGVLNPNPKVIYTPNAGFAGEDVFTYTVRDNNGAVSNEASVTITVINQSPIAEGYNAATDKGIPVSFILPSSDPDGFVDSWSIATPPSNGNVVVDQGIATYSPNVGFDGTDVFTFTVRDNDGAFSNEATVLLTVQNVPPVAGDDNPLTEPNLPVAIDVLQNDGDPNRGLDPTTLTVVSGPANGQAIVQNGQIVYIPNPGFAGPDQFTYNVRDLAGNASNEALVTVTFVALPPVAGDDSASTEEGMPVTIDVLSNDFDQPGEFVQPGFLDTTSLVVSAGPARGSVAIVGSQVVYTPSVGTAGILVVDDLRDIDDGVYTTGHLSLREAVRLANADSYTDTFRYTVKDQAGNISNEATVSVHVQAKPTTITFAPRFYNRGTASILLNRVGDTSEGNTALAITSSITIKGPTGPNRILLNGSGTAVDLRAFLVTSVGNLTLENIMLRNWSSDENGGAIFVETGGSLTATNCTFSTNTAFGNGGAIYNLGVVSFLGSNLTNNSATGQGGAIWNSGSLTLTNTPIRQNRADQGAGLFNQYGTVNVFGGDFTQNAAKDDGGGFNNFLGQITLTDTLFDRNSAGGMGGGFYNAGTAALTRANLRNNSAIIGGGFENGIASNPYNPFFSYPGTITLTGGTISGNTASQNGAGFSNYGTANLSGLTITGNRAGTEGGGLMNFSGTATLTDAVLTSNTAQKQGGGIFNDLGTINLVRNSLTSNTASAGGGMFNNSVATVNASTFSRNIASEGAGIFSEFGATTITTSTFVGNTGPRGFRGPQGPSIYNKFGTLTISGNFPGVFDESARNAVPPATDLPTAFPALSGNAQYQLSADHRLLWKLPGSNWTVLDVGVVSYKVAPNGDLYLLNDHHELKRFQAGYSWTTLRVGVKSFEMDGSGGVYALDDFGRVSRYRALDQYWLLPAIQEGQTPIAEDPPTETFILKAARFPAGFGGTLAIPPQYFNPELTFPFEREFGVGSPPIIPTPSTQENAILILPRMGFSDIRFVSELLADTIDPPRFFPGIGLAQMHHAQWKVTIYSTNVMPRRQEVLTIYIDQSHLHAYVAGSPITTVFVNGVGAQATPFTAGIQSQTNPALQASLQAESNGIVTQPDLGSPFDRTVRSLVTGPDGTIYQFGSDTSGYLWVGAESAPVMLTKLQSGLPWANPNVNGTYPWLAGSWEPAFHLYRIDGQMAIWPTKVLNGITYDLTADHELRRMSQGSSQWETLAVGVQAFAMTPNGTIFGIFAGNELRMLSPGSSNWQTLDVINGGNSGVDSFSFWSYFNVVPDGTLFLINTNRELRRLLPGATELDLLDTGVTSFQLAGDGTLYEFGEHGLKRLEGRDDWTLLDSGAFYNGTIAFDGSLFYFAGNINDVSSYVTKYFQPPNFVGDFKVGPDNTLYALDSEARLRRLPAGSTQWETIQKGVDSFSMAPNGTLFAITQNHELLRRLPNSQGWTLIESGVQNFKMAPDGTLFLLTSNQELRRLLPGANRWTVLDRGVQSFIMTAEGSVLELNGRHQLRRLTRSAGLDRWTTLEQEVQSFTQGANGTVYALNAQHELMRLTARDHWVILDVGVQSFLVARNSFNSVYVLSDQKQLKRLDAGYSWTVLQEDVETITLDPVKGTVYASDAQGQVQLFWASPTTPLMPAIREGSPEPLAEDPPDHLTILRAANVEVGGNPPQYILPSEPFPLWRELGYFEDQASSKIASPSALQAATATSGELKIRLAQDIQIVTERIIDNIDPVRSFPNVGLAQLHHARWKCTVYYTDANGPGTRVIFIDMDHLHALFPTN